MKDTILPTGGGPNRKSPVFVRKGDWVIMYNAGFNYDKSIWGEDVDVFNPQRWVDRRPMWEFIPFSGGPRICPAQQQVLTQVTYLLVRLAREFKRIENRDGVLEYVEFVKTLTQSRNGVKVALLTN